MSKMVMLFFIALLVAPFATAQSNGMKSKITASRCRTEILSLADKPSDYFQRMPYKRLQYLYDLAGDCGDTTVAGLSKNELNNVDEVYSTIDNVISAAPVEHQRIQTDVNAPDPLHCRAHLTMLRSVDWHRDLDTATLGSWQGQLSDCVISHVEIFTAQDLRHAFAINDMLHTKLLTNSFDEDVAEAKRWRAEGIAQANKDCGADHAVQIAQYDSLVQRFNSLVNDYNDLLDRARRLANAPPIFLSMPMHQSIHCNGMNIGSMSTIDCY